MENEKKFFLVECLIIKDENQYLIEHLTQNALSGIEYFYIYDNYSNESVFDYLNNNAPELLSICNIIKKKTEDNFQEDCYYHFIKEFARQCCWVAFVDTDEIFEGSLYDFCKKYDSVYNSLVFKQIIHGANNQIFESDESLCKRFMSDIITEFEMVKNVVKTDCLLFQEAHRTYMKNGNLRQFIVENSEDVKLHHFYFRSFEEYVKKILRGTANPKGIPYLISFFRYNPNITIESCQPIFAKYNVNLKLRAKYCIS